MVTIYYASCWALCPSWVQACRRNSSLLSASSEPQIAGGRLKRSTATAPRRRGKLFGLAALTFLVVTSAASLAQGSTQLVYQVSDFDVLVAGANTSHSSRPIASGVDTLTYETALGKALASNPRLRAAALEIEARRALTRQANRISNPFLDAEAENVSSNGPEEAITTAMLGQLVELGGDRLARHRLARSEANRAVVDAAIEALFIRGITRARFAEASAAQAQSRLSRTLRALADTILAATREQVVAGDRSPIDQTRAEILLAEARTEVDKADAEQGAAYARLAAVWGATPDFEAVAPLPTPKPIPPLDSLLAALPQSASMAVWEVEAERRAANLRLEQARRIPDITLTAGYRRFTETGDGALVGRLNLPIPLFNRNQGGVDAARFRLLAVEADQAAAVSEMRAVLAERYAAITSAYTEAEALRIEVIPRATEVTERIEEGYRAGRFSLLDLLDAQRTLTAASARYQEALARYYITAADIEQLTSRPLEPIE